jgi:hypothetical protein
MRFLDEKFYMLAAREFMQVSLNPVHLAKTGTHADRHTNQPGQLSLAN